VEHGTRLFLDTVPVYTRSVFDITLSDNIFLVSCHLSIDLSVDIFVVPNKTHHTSLQFIISQYKPGETFLGDSRNRFRLVGYVSVFIQPECSELDDTVTASVRVSGFAFQGR